MINEWVIGIDPGISGAMALVRVEADLAELALADDLPVHDIRGKSHLDIYGIGDRLRTIWHEAHQRQVKLSVYIEDVHAAPGQGVSSMFRFGKAYGELLGLCAGLRLSVDQVQPLKWQRAIGLGTGEPDAARARVCQLYPMQASLFARKKDHNRADAALIATAGVRLGQLARH